MGLDDTEPRPMPSRTMLIDELRSRVERREYDVDPGAVAEAMLARHARWSNPASRCLPVAPARTSSGRPGTTRPTWLTDGRPGGPQTSSS
jgi:Anti-sigma-28 factor, FlgM